MPPPVAVLDNLTGLYEFQDAAQDTEFDGHFVVDAYGYAASASMFGQPLASLVLLGLLRVAVRRRWASRAFRLTRLQ